MKARFAALLLLGALVAVAGCPAKPPVSAPADENKTSRNTKPKTPAPSATKAAGTATGTPFAPPSTAAKPTASASSTATTGSASPGPTTGGSTSPAPSPTATTSTAPAEDAPTNVTVIINAMQFLPGRVTVKQGGTISFINRDSVAHSVVPDGNTAFTASATLAAPTGGAVDGGVANFTFATAGEFKYVCGIHGSMSGTVVVVP